MLGWLNLKIRHGDFVDVVVVGTSHLCEQLRQGTCHDAWVVVSAKHRVRLPGACDHAKIPVIVTHLIQYYYHYGTRLTASFLGQPR